MIQSHDTSIVEVATYPCTREKTAEKQSGGE